jgi:hypothetical protein
LKLASVDKARIARKLDTIKISQIRNLNESIAGASISD